MGAIVKGVASAFGGKKRRETEKTTKAAFETAEGAVTGQKFENAYAGLGGGSYTAGQYSATKAEGATLEDAIAMERTELGKAQGYESEGYESQGYESQGYTAGQTNIAGIQRGANTGLTNNMNNLQVNTAEADMAAVEADQALAASQDLAAQAGTGAGGATALAAAAAKSKRGIAASIGQQESQNNIRRATAEQQLQQQQLAQGNLASQFDLGQSQVNMASVNQSRQFGAQAQNQAAQFGASAANQASQFGASAANQAAQFGAQAQNQFALSQFGADNQRNQFNASTQNRFNQTRFNSANQFEMANVNAQNQGSQFNIGNKISSDRYAQDTAMRAAELAAGGSMRVQDMEYGRNQDTMNRRAGEYGAAKDARAAAKADLIGGIAGIGDLAMTAATGGFGGAAKKFMDSDRRLKKNIEEIAISVEGYKIYNFEYKDTKRGEGIFQGVMSDEVPGYAVRKNKDGFDSVDYSVIDVEFKNIK